MPGGLTNRGMIAMLEAHHADLEPLTTCEVCGFVAPEAASDEQPQE